ncbi:MAG: glycosyltransferase family 2 protein [Gemmataceae bacterium]
MHAPRPLISVVCPAYDEEAVLAYFHERLGSVLTSLEDRYRFEILYVDDGSADGTLEVMRLLAAQDARVRYLSLSRNFGKEAAISAGFEEAKGDALVMLDTDLQHPPEVIERLLEQWRGGFDVVLTEREKTPYTSWWRNLAARSFASLLAASARDPQPATSDFMLLSRRAVDAVGRLRETHRFTRGLVRWIGYPTTSITFRVADRPAGASKFTMSRLLGLAGDGLFSFSRLPQRLITRGASFFFALTFFYIVLAPWCPPLKDISSEPALHVVIALLLLMTGVLLTAFGICAEYLCRILEQTKQRPIYLLKERGGMEAGVIPAKEASDGKRAA